MPRLHSGQSNFTYTVADLGTAQVQPRAAPPAGEAKLWVDVLVLVETGEQSRKLLCIKNHHFGKPYFQLDKGKVKFTKIHLHHPLKRFYRWKMNPNKVLSWPMVGTSFRIFAYFGAMDIIFILLKRAKNCRKIPGSMS